jgi:hypothetical protein
MSDLARIANGWRSEACPSRGSVSSRRKSFKWHILDRSARCHESDVTASSVGPASALTVVAC